MMGCVNVRHLALAVAVVPLLVSCGHSRVVRSASNPSHKAASSHHTQSMQHSKPQYGKTVQVQRGQTVYRIATENGITPLDLALWNKIAPPYTIYPGQRLRLYPEDAAAVASAPMKPTAPTGTAAAAVATTAPKQASVTPPVTPPVAPATSDIAWKWPTDGGVLSSFANGDPTRQGIDIGGRGGQPVRAAADGVVVYSGSGLVGYGELIIVKHNEQWLSAYGHNRSRKVNEGTLVKAGQEIAEMGRSGASRDMLHFEIRYNGKPVDPQLYLPKR